MLPGSHHAASIRSPVPIIRSENAMPSRLLRLSRRITTVVDGSRDKSCSECNSFNRRRVRIALPAFDIKQCRTHAIYTVVFPRWARINDSAVSRNSPSTTVPAATLYVANLNGKIITLWTAGNVILLPIVRALSLTFTHYTLLEVLKYESLNTERPHLQSAHHLKEQHFNSGLSTPGWDKLQSGH